MTGIRHAGKAVCDRDVVNRLVASWFGRKDSADNCFKDWTDVTHPFAPSSELADSLLPFSVPPTSDGSHDLSHLMRVWKAAFQIQATEGGNVEILGAAVLLHDCVAIEKSDPRRAEASALAADRAAGVLRDLNWPAGDIAAVCHAIICHSFSAGQAPQTIEAKVLQDADRLDAIGAIGAARCFYTAGRMGSGLYDPNDPGAAQRPLDDRAFALDHFKAKLLTLSQGFQTATGADLAQQRHDRLQRFMDDFLSEI
ncbi:MAG: HD domain-containing protein [Rhodobacterales bacterium]